MNYVLFIGSKVGFEALRLMIDLNCSIWHVFVESEHSHEHEKYFGKSVEVCELHHIQYRFDPRIMENSCLMLQIPHDCRYIKQPSLAV